MSDCLKIKAPQPGFDWPQLLELVAVLFVLCWFIAGCNDTTKPLRPSDSAAVTADLACDGALAVLRAAAVPPAPKPEPEPGGLCLNCNGTGKVGDGREGSTFPCPVCKGTGKSSMPPVTASAFTNSQGATP